VLDYFALVNSFARILSWPNDGRLPGRSIFIGVAIMLRRVILPLANRYGIGFAIYCGIAVVSARSSNPKIGNTIFAIILVP
jgi:hypothetical protein